MIIEVIDIIAEHLKRRDGRCIFDVCILINLPCHWRWQLILLQVFCIDLERVQLRINALKIRRDQSRKNRMPHIVWMHDVLCYLKPCKTPRLHLRRHCLPITDHRQVIILPQRRLNRLRAVADRVCGKQQHQRGITLRQKNFSNQFS